MHNVYSLQGQRASESTERAGCIERWNDERRNDYSSSSWKWENHTHTDTHTKYRMNAVVETLDLLQFLFFFFPLPVYIRHVYLLSLFSFFRTLMALPPPSSLLPRSSRLSSHWHMQRDSRRVIARELILRVSKHVYVVYVYRLWSTKLTETRATSVRIRERGGWLQTPQVKGGCLCLFTLPRAPGTRNSTTK